MSCFNPLSEIIIIRSSMHRRQRQCLKDSNGNGQYAENRDEALRRVRNLPLSRHSQFPLCFMKSFFALSASWGPT
jgi:hypothetical protein